MILIFPWSLLWFSVVIGRNCCPISTPTSCHRVSTRACTPAAGSSPYSAPRWPFRWLAGNITIQMHTKITQKPSCLTLCANCRAKMGGWPFLESHFPAAAVHPRQYGNLLRPHILPSHSNTISKKVCHGPLKILSAGILIFPFLGNRNNESI